MTKFTCITSASLLSGLLVLGAAAPSFAATQPTTSASSTHTTTPRDIPAFTAGIDSYNRDTHVATLSGTGDWFSNLGLNQKKANGTTVFSSSERSYIDGETGAWKVEIDDVFQGDTVRVSNGLGPTPQTLRFDDAVPEPEATVSTTIHDGVVEGVYTFARHGLIELQNADGATIAGTKLADNWNATPGTPFTYRFTLPDTGRTSTFTIGTQFAFVEHTTVPFTINEGVTAPVPAAPSVEASTSASSAIPAVTIPAVTIRAEARATIRVRDAAGTVVAVKMANAQGAAQIPVPVSAAGDAGYTATQSAGGATSSATAFTH